jgi:hypothetical protein
VTCACCCCVMCGHRGGIFKDNACLFRGGIDALRTRSFFVLADPGSATLDINWGEWCLQVQEGVRCHPSRSAVQPQGSEGSVQGSEGRSVFEVVYKSSLKEKQGPAQ